MWPSHPVFERLGRTGTGSHTLVTLCAKTRLQLLWATVRIFKATDRKIRKMMLVALAALALCMSMRTICWQSVASAASECTEGTDSRKRVPRKSEWVAWRG